MKTLGINQKFIVRFLFSYVQGQVTRVTQVTTQTSITNWITGTRGRIFIPTLGNAADDTYLLRTYIVVA
jgi:hypothetical protein